MRQKKLLILLAMLLALCGFAAADPVLTDGAFTAWIGTDGALFLRNGDQLVTRVDIQPDDLLSYEEDTLYLLEHSGQILALRGNGAELSVFVTEPTDADIEDRGEARFILLEGTLSVAGRQLSSSAVAAVTDSTWLYWAERQNGSWRLRQERLIPSEDTTQISVDAAQMNAPLNGQLIPEPLAISVTGEGLALTAADHSVVGFDLISGQRTEYPAISERTAQAAFVEGKLLRFVQDENRAWRLEAEEEGLRGSTAGTQNQGATPTPVLVTPALITPTPAPTSLVTPTQKPTNTPTSRPTATPTPTPDDVIRLGDRGTEVWNMQARLDALGYPVGKIDGIYGQATQKAVNLFQDAIHVAEKNYVTKSLLRRMNAADAPEYDAYLPLSKGDRGMAVRMMQERLKELGYDPQKIDGIYGAMTVQAVALFQEAAALSGEDTTGMTASRKILQKLYSDTAPTRKYTVSGGVYRLEGGGAVLIGPSSRNAKSLKIPATIDADGKQVPVIAIAKGACRKMTKLTKLTIGANVQTIEDSAFVGCTVVERIIVQTRLLTDSSVGSSVFSDVPETATVTCDEDLVKAYKKLFRSRGLPKAVEFNP